jgi:hypothetical protein
LLKTNFDKLHTFSPSTGKVYARTHGQEAKHGSFSRIKELASMLVYGSTSLYSSINHLCFFGENMTAIHSIKYNQLTSYFYLFAIKNSQNNQWLSWSDVEQIANDLGLHTVPVLYRSSRSSRSRSSSSSSSSSSSNSGSGSGSGSGRGNTFDIERWMKRRSSMLSNVCTINNPEGFVIRLEKSFNDNEFHQSMGKYVRFNHIQTDDTWRRTWKKATIQNNSK